MKRFSKLLPTILLIIFEIAVGVMLLIDGEKLTSIIFIGFGSLLLIIGLISLISAIVKGSKEGSIQTLALIISVLMIAIGAFFAAASGYVTQIVTTVTLIYGIIMIISGVIKLADYFAFRKTTLRVSGFVAFSAVISIILGIVFVFNPFGTALVIWTILGIALLISAALDIITLIIYSRAVKQHENGSVQ